MQGGDSSGEGWDGRWERRASHGVREREGLLAEGVRVRTRKFTPKAAGEGVEPCEAKLPTELRGWETGRCGSLGGCSEVGSGGGSCLVATASAGFPGSGGSWG